MFILRMDLLHIMFIIFISGVKCMVLGITASTIITIPRTRRNAVMHQMWRTQQRALHIQVVPSGGSANKRGAHVFSQTDDFSDEGMNKVNDHGKSCLVSEWNFYKIVLEVLTLSEFLKLG